MNKRAVTFKYEFSFATSTTEIVLFHTEILANKLDLNSVFFSSYIDNCFLAFDYKV